MKNIKYIPVLAIVALLSACNTTKSNNPVKEPKFEKEGEAVEYDAFLKEVGLGLSGLDFNSGKKMGSKEGSFYAAYEEDCVLEREGKEFGRETYTEIEDHKFKMDAKASIINDDGEYYVSILDKNGQYTYKDKNGEKWSTSYQQVKYDGEDYYGCVDKLGKVVNLYGTISSGWTLSDYHDYIAKGTLYYEIGFGTIQNRVNALTGLSEESLPFYSFMKNGSTYTVTYQPEAETSEKRTEDEANELIYTYESTTTEKIQLTFDRGNLKVAIYDVYTSKYTYAKDYQSYKAGDVDSVKTTNILTSEYKNADLSLKEASYDGFIFMIY